MEAEELASEDDMYTVVTARRARALLASARGEHDEAIAHANAGARLVEATDYLEQQAETYGVLGEVLIAADRPDEAASRSAGRSRSPSRKDRSCSPGSIRTLLDSLTAPR